MLFRNILLSAGLLLGATTAFAAPQQKAAKPHIIVTCDPELDDYYLRFDHRDYGKSVLAFTPSIEILDLIKQNCPRKAVNKL